VVSLGCRLSAGAAAARAWLASISRHCPPRVVLVIVIALLAQGASATTDRHEASRQPASAAPSTTAPEVGRQGLGASSSWRRPASRPSPTTRPAGGPIESWVTRIVTGPSGLVDARGHRWLPDTGHVGGRQGITRTPIEGTSSPAIYQRERSGMRAYAIPVPAQGTYAVNLYLAETRFSSPGQRVFDVAAEGAVKVSGVDIVKAAGRNHAHHVIFTVAVTDGRLDLGFTNRVGQAKVGGIEVAFLRRSVAPERLVWSDEFSGAERSPVDRRRWRHETGGAWGEGELQAYTSRTANAYHDGGGHLVISARAERFRGADSITRDYTSARVSTKGRYSFRYGRFEARLQTPVGRGLWPAFWALGDDIDRSGWPACGEIDVMENLGQEPTKASGTIHGPRGRDDYEPGRTVVHSAPLSQGFHTYGVQWLPGSIQFFFDGRPYGSVTAADLPAGSRWVFDHPFYLILNVAVGGRWAGSPDASTDFPQLLRVDHVRVYQ
jgi:Glycosyl hydrolases family 16/Malectin domain